MRRWWLGILVLPALGALYACGGAEPAPAKGASDTCPVADPGPPPVCPEGCTWDGAECRKHSGIIIVDSNDSGPPNPTPSANDTSSAVPPQ